MTRADDVQAVVFGIGGESFALPVEVVREILDHRNSCRIPHAPEWVLGLIDLRGQSMPVVDLRLRLGIEPTETSPATRILVSEVRHDDRTTTLGIVVDRVIEVATFGAAEIGPAPDIGTDWLSGHIAGVAHRRDGFVIHLRLDSIFTSNDMEVSADRAAACLPSPLL